MQGSIQLSDAAVHLIGQKPGTRPQTYLTVERRLYDIGSILSTLDLIKRTYIEGKRSVHAFICSLYVVISYKWCLCKPDTSPDPNCCA